MKDHELLTAGVIVLVLWLLFNSKGKTTVSNAETWQWTDWQGKQREITVHRDVRSA